MNQIAIIGAGLSGLTLATELSSFCDITLFEKSPAAGGRMASRRLADHSFDHGAQFFSAKTPAFRQFLVPLLEAGVVADWQARFVELDNQTICSRRQWTGEFPHYVGMPDMASIGEWLSQGLSIQYNSPISQLHRTSDKWLLSDNQGHGRGEFDWVIVTLPASQSAALLPATFAEHDVIRQIQMKACYALMLTLHELPALPFDAALVKNADISWISVNSSKPGRSGAAMVVHATNDWADRHLDTDPALLKQDMIQTVCQISGLVQDNIKHADIKRWRYANLPTQNGRPFYLDTSRQLAACGDWCLQGRVEAAFTSAFKLAQSLTHSL